jgi:hypothetical protein
MRGSTRANRRAEPVLPPRLERKRQRAIACRRMALRTFVSFEASAPKDEQPPGRQLADSLARGLTEAGLDVYGPDEHEGWAWALGRRLEGGDVFSLVGLTDDPPMEWQVHSYARRTRPKLLGGIRTEQLDQDMRAWCEAIHAVLMKVPGIRSVRWYERETFERDHGETWFDTPAD